MKHILDLVMKYDTSNSEECPNDKLIASMNEIGDYLKSFGCAVELQEYSVASLTGNSIKHANLVARPANSTGPYILFQGHLDTVPFEGPYQYQITDHDVQGRGAVDMKGAVACMIRLMEATSQRTDMKYSPLLLLTSDEEANGFAGMRHFLKTNSLPIYFCINGEPSENQVCPYFRGVFKCSFLRKGRTGHSSSQDNPRLIETTIPALQAVRQFLDEARLVSDPHFGETIGALTVIQSGIKDNQLPEQIEVHFNLRTVTDSQTYVALFDRIVRPVLTDDAEVRLLHIDQIATLFPEGCRESLKNGFVSAGVPYIESVMHAFTEASLLNQSGIPTVVCGPGSMKLAHVNPDLEIVSMRELDAYVKLLEALLMAF